MKHFILKKPGLKLIKLYLEDQDKRIADIKIMGDFFVYPESAIEELEKFLIGDEIDKKLMKKIEDYFKENEVELFGLTAEALFEAIEGCSKSE